ncbi:hypothetical protein D3C87_1592650 [compost metagenome]
MLQPCTAIILHPNLDITEPSALNLSHPPLPKHQLLASSCEKENEEYKTINKKIILRNNTIFILENYHEHAFWFFTLYF